ncbi:uncharacterized protein LOC125677502 isoform X3 [Ostrea edulis]|uniref:uncharacterized protein LOC125677502 isoform X3 n=1 Tax=Ostrea edulis TaxID=37623 RepID=UPI0024AF4EBA|nr:uncharacterized protein LOC125677502 isoform X3 [Ostrea edulis]
MSLPTFSPPHMNTEKLRKLFGSLRVPDVSRNTSRRGASATKAPEVLRNSAGAPAKKDLIEAYRRNEHRARTDISGPEFIIMSPDPQLYRDLHCDKSFSN